MAEQDEAHKSIFFIALLSQPYSKISKSLSPSRPLKAFDPVNIITGESMSARETERFHNEGKLEVGGDESGIKKKEGNIFMRGKR